MLKVKKSLPKKGRFYSVIIGLVLSFLLIGFIVLSYFFILISTGQKSFPILNKKVESYVNENLKYGNRISVGKTSIKLVSLHKIRVTFDDIKLNLGGQREISLPEIESDFSLFRLVLFNYVPSKIKIIEPLIEIEAGDKYKPNITLNNLSQDDILTQELLPKKIQEFLPLLKNGTVVIKTFEIESAKIIFKNRFKNNVVLIRNLTFNTKLKSGILNFALSSKFNVNSTSADSLLNGICRLENVKGLDCNFVVNDLVPKSLSTFNRQLLQLEKIQASFSGNLELKFNDNYEFSSSTINFTAKGGSFTYPAFFTKKIEFSDFLVSAKLDNISKTLNISKLVANFKNSSDQSVSAKQTKLSMSVAVTDFMDQDKERIEMQIGISDTPTDNLDRYWPVFLSHNGIRDWVIKHINSGNIKDAYTRMVFEKSKNVTNLKKISAELVFSGLELNYSDHFPKITKIDGVAAFTEKDMKIDLISGDALGSKIKSATILIPNFNSRKIFLEIYGKLSGEAADALKHIDYKSNFAEKVEDYFNGRAETLLKIKIPLIDKLRLKDVYLKVTSDIKDFNNSYITQDSHLLIDATKEFGSENFAADVDLTGANLDLKYFGLHKKAGVESRIRANLLFDDSNQIDLREINWIQGKSKISGNILLATSPVSVLEVKLKNLNFGGNDKKNNFNLLYKIGRNSGSRTIKLEGKSVDLSSFINSSSSIEFEDREAFEKNNFQVNLGTIYLANGQHFKNVVVNINCFEAVCLNSFARADMGSDESANLSISRFRNDDYSTINGRITDISILAKAFNITNKINLGDAKINGTIEYADGQPLVKAELLIDSRFVVLRNDFVNKISNSGVFSRIKDGLLATNEINFDNLKLELQIQDNVLNIKRLIANSNYMGITGKGKIDFNKKISVKINGLIVPGYVVNKLFGIGKIPLVGNLVVGGEGGGLFAAKYEFSKEGEQEGQFKVNEMSALLPGGIRGIFDLF